jgi:hypothetical protein
MAEMDDVVKSVDRWLSYNKDLSNILASITRRDLSALKDLVDFSEKEADIEMLNIVKNHLLAMRRDVHNLLQDRR